MSTHEAKDVKVFIAGHEMKPFYGRWDDISYRVKFPETKAEITIFWFLFGQYPYMPPKHLNCRCKTVSIQSKDELK